jgi:hypothetical protein
MSWERPLLHPDLSRFMDISHALGFKVNITTNGTLISERQDDLLGAGALRQVNFSLHSMEKVLSDEGLDRYTSDIFSLPAKRWTEETFMCPTGFGTSALLQLRNSTDTCLKGSRNILKPIIHYGMVLCRKTGSPYGTDCF